MEPTIYDVYETAYNGPGDEIRAPVIKGERYNFKYCTEMPDSLPCKMAWTPTAALTCLTEQKAKSGRQIISGLIIWLTKQGAAFVELDLGFSQGDVISFKGCTAYEEWPCFFPYSVLRISN